MKYMIAHNFVVQESKLSNEFLADMRAHAGQYVTMKPMGEFDEHYELRLANGRKFSCSGREYWSHRNNIYPIIMEVKDKVFLGEELFTL